MSSSNKDHQQDITLATINEKLNAIQAQEERILSQVKATNGRVTSLEIWRAYLIGGLIVLTTIIGWIMNTITK
jgi:hypothetical protein